MSCRTAVLAAFLLSLAAAPAPADEKPRLIVVVYFDQLRGDFLERWQPLFGEGGFRRLQRDGAWFTDCHYPYATTTTGPGHASVLAGCSGDVHGVINNNWYDRKAGEDVYCAGSTRYELVPRPARNAKVRSVGNPDRMLSPNVADVLKEATGGKGKVFGLSLKDRSAIFPAGKAPDGAYWFNGRFVTSTFYRDALHSWVAEFNESGVADSYFGKDWGRFRPKLDYVRHSGPDDGPGEGTGHFQGKTFPHSMNGGLKTVGPKYYDAVANSPFGNDLLFQLAKKCVIAEELGKDGVPDLLTVSFSSNDLIGHTWGPDSQEVLDVTLRSDALMTEFLDFLDRTVGEGRHAMIVTSDHGICPTPEVSRVRGFDARRIDPAMLLLGAERFLRTTFGKPDDPEAINPKDPNRWIEAVSAPNIYLNERVIRSRKLDPREVAAKLAAWYREQDGIARAFTRADLESGDAGRDVIQERTRRSYHPDRSGDVIVVLKPYYLLSNPGTFVRPATGTTHGAPCDYDTHVAFLAHGPGIPGGRRTEAVTPLHGAAIAAHFLGIKPPKDCRYDLPATLLKP